MLTRQLTSALRTTSRAATGHRYMSYQKGGENLQQWITELTTRPPTVSTDRICAKRAAQLLRSLPTRAGEVSAGSDLHGNLPKCYHLIYFQSQDWLSDLAADGTTTEYNAPAPFSRRMWAGGAFEWNKGTEIKLDEEATQAISVRSVDVKSEKMMFVNQVREFRPSSAKDGEWSIREERNHVFRPDEVAQGNAKPKAPGPPMPQPQYTVSYTPSSPLLFRYSALTYNAHKIHYDLEWTRSKEGHPDLVVHGPMTATLLVELADQGARDTATFLQRFEYRATSPMYVNREIKLNAHWEERGKKLTLWAEQEGRVGMKATATFQAA